MTMSESQELYNKGMLRFGKGFLEPVEISNFVNKKSGCIYSAPGTAHHSFVIRGRFHGSHWTDEAVEAKGSQ